MTTRITAFLSLVSCFLCVAAPGPARADLLRDKERILFLGDSITHSGHY
ncbi:MAG: hypothetical protein GWO24_32935, partial [Akkermansiaceae bacterium]|nr:hypothetical protein [Akkermansiaceae bacterium]